MRIINGHDYYDSALGFGQDDQVVFVRGTDTVSAEGCPLWSFYPHSLSTESKSKNWHYGYSRQNRVIDKQHGELWLRSVSLYVAGVRYGGIVAVTLSDKIVNTFWDYESFEAWLEPYGCQPFKPKTEIYKWASDKEAMQRFPNLHSWFEKTPASQKELDFLISNRIATAITCCKPVYYTKPSNIWHINSAAPVWTLKEFGFAKVMDPYALFQELSMFIGGVLPKDQPPMVEITDPDVKVAKHGFNKWSFRKHKNDPNITE